MSKLLPMLMTAAGTIRPGKALVLGAGVAGLQAIATARRLGAKVEAFDVRPAVKEQVESLGAKFVDVPYLTEEEREIAEGKGGYARPMPADWMRRQAEAVHQRNAHTGSGQDRRDGRMQRRRGRSHRRRAKIGERGHAQNEGERQGS